MTVVKNMQERERSVFVDRLASGGVNEVPGRADISIRNIEGVIEGA
jgi:hypothetical protein